MRFNAMIAALILLIAGVSAAQSGAPESVKLTYDVTLNGLHIAQMTEQFEAREDRYRAVSDSTPVGLFALFQRRPVRFVSHGRVTKRGLRPDQFEGARGADDPRRVSAEFDWQAQRITLDHDGQNQSLELPADAQDRLSMMYQFMFLAYDRVSEFAFLMTNGRKLDRYRYSVTPAVEIDTPLGRMSTLHLVKLREPGDSVTEIWIAPQHAHLPVKMLVVENGSRYEQVVTGIEIKP
jgi:hypothetical protein